MVFNLVESLFGSDACAVSVPALLDGLGIPYTGAPASSVALASDKIAAKRIMRDLGLPTADWHPGGAARDFAPGRYIVKARFEHASFGLEEDAVVELDSRAAADRAIAAASARLSRPCFAERFVDGREFNLSVLDGGDELTVLPAAEIDFSAFPRDRLRVVGYRAKWIETSFEYHHTPRRFDFEPADAPLLDRLDQLSRSAFGAFGLRGWARIDFRVDASGPWILEVNANPCLTPDAGFAAALARAGIPYRDAIARILRAASHESP
jgi:D-alanine-D-alanine ligase